MAQVSGLRACIHFGAAESVSLFVGLGYELVSSFSIGPNVT